MKHDNDFLSKIHNYTIFGYFTSNDIVPYVYILHTFRKNNLEIPSNKNI